MRCAHSIRTFACSTLIFSFCCRRRCCVVVSVFAQLQIEVILLKLYKYKFEIPILNGKIILSLSADWQNCFMLFFSTRHIAHRNRKKGSLRQAACRLKLREKLFLKIDLNSHSIFINSKNDQIAKTTGKKSGRKRE